MSAKIGRAQIMERTEKIGDQLSIVSDVLETSDRFEFTGEMVRDLADRSLRFERAVPRPSTVIVEPVAARPCVRKGRVDEGVAGPTEHKLSRIQVRQPSLLRLQAPVGDALQCGKIFKRPVVGGKRQQHRIFQAAGRDQSNCVALCQVERRQRHSKTAAQGIDMLTDLKHLGNATLDHRVERTPTTV